MWPARKNAGTLRPSTVLVLWPTEDEELPAKVISRIQLSSQAFHRAVLLRYSTRAAPPKLNAAVCYTDVTVNPTVTPSPLSSSKYVIITPQSSVVGEITIPPISSVGCCFIALPPWRRCRRPVLRVNTTTCTPGRNRVQPNQFRVRTGPQQLKHNARLSISAVALCLGELGPVRASRGSDRATTSDTYRCATQLNGFRSGPTPTPDALAKIPHGHSRPLAATLSDDNCCPQSGISAKRLDSCRPRWRCKLAGHSRTVADPATGVAGLPGAGQSATGPLGHAYGCGGSGLPGSITAPGGSSAWASFTAPRMLYQAASLTTKSHAVQISNISTTRPHEMGSGRVG